MRFTPQGSAGRGVEIDITAMVDVVFLLIIFFLTTSSLVELTRAQLDLPKEAGEESAEEERSGIVINITKEGEFIIESATVTRTELLARIDAALAESGDEALDLLVRADRSAPLVYINELATDLMDRDVRGWRLATEVPGGGGGGRGGR